MINKFFKWIKKLFKNKSLYNSAMDKYKYFKVPIKEYKYPEYKTDSDKKAATYRRLEEEDEAKGTRAGNTIPLVDYKPTTECVSVLNHKNKINNLYLSIEEELIKLRKKIK